MRVPTPKQIVAATALIVGITLITPLAASESPPPSQMQSAQASAPAAYFDGEGLSALTTTTTVLPTTTTTEAPTTITTEPPAPEPVLEAASAPTGGGDPSDPASWERLAGCETGGTYDWATNTGNGYYGGLQFSLSSWQSVGGVGYPHEASKATQIQMGQRLHAQGGWNHWPGCARSFGWI